MICYRYSAERIMLMGWKEKVKEFGGGDLAFLSEDGEVLDFIVVGEPVLLEGKFKGNPTEKIGCPVITDDGFVLFIVGKRLFRKIAKHEDEFSTNVLQAIRHGEQGDIKATYDLKVLDDKPLLDRLQELQQLEFKPEMIYEAIESAKEVMQS